MKFLRRLLAHDGEGTERLEVEPTESRDSGPCDCCGERTRIVYGLLHRGDATEAAYVIHWTPGQVDRHGAHFDLIVGRWGESTDASERFAVSLEFRHTERGPEFMVIDATDRDVGSSELVSRAMRRSDVIETPLAARVFGMVDAIWAVDPRIAEIRGDA